MPKRRFMDAVGEDVEVTEEDAEDRTEWRRENPLWQPLMGEAKRLRRLQGYRAPVTLAMSLHSATSR